MWALTKPGGGVLWYDFIYNNPRNLEVRGVPLHRIRQLFPEGTIHHWKLTLARPSAAASPASTPISTMSSTSSPSSELISSAGSKRQMTDDRGRRTEKTDPQSSIPDARSRILAGLQLLTPYLSQNIPQPVPGIPDSLFESQPLSRPKDLTPYLSLDNLAGIIEKITEADSPPT
jgi:hypothetical protein